MSGSNCILLLLTANVMSCESYVPLERIGMRRNDREPMIRIIWLLCGMMVHNNDNSWYCLS